MNNKLKIAHCIAGQTKLLRPGGTTTEEAIEIKACHETKIRRILLNSLRPWVPFTD
jgi:hypothetical protein